jgi:hypothetical protein
MGIKCTSDVSPVTFIWDGELGQKVKPVSSPAKCIRWDGLISYVAENGVLTQQDAINDDNEI